MFLQTCFTAARLPSWVAVVNTVLWGSYVHLLPHILLLSFHLNVVDFGFSCGRLLTTFCNIHYVTAQRCSEMAMRVKFNVTLRKLKDRVQFEAIKKAQHKSRRVLVVKCDNKSFSMRTFSKFSAGLSYDSIYYSFRDTHCTTEAFSMLLVWPGLLLILVTKLVRKLQKLYLQYFCRYFPAVDTNSFHGSGSFPVPSVYNYLGRVRSQCKESFLTALNTINLLPPRCL